jgi:hypothetical protein
MHKIIFKDKTVEYVSKELHDKIWKDSTNTSLSTFNIGKNVYNFSDIWKIEEPVNPYPVFDPMRYTGTRSPERRMKAIENIAKGIKKCIPSKTGKPERLLELFRRRYAEAKLDRVKL